MLSKVYNFWQLLKANMWFTPALFCLFFCIATLSLFYLDSTYLTEVKLPDVIFNGSIADAKSITLVLLSAMITMATLAVSITIVALSLSASQMGPRLIKTFMSDSRTKQFIGVFFGTVIACFVLTVILHSGVVIAETPKLTVSAVFALCFINLFVLLGFVHHVGQSCIADNVILKVAQKLSLDLERLTSNAADREPRPASAKGSVKDSSKDSDKNSWPSDFERISRCLYFECSGYIQNINYEHLVQIAEAESCRIKVRVKAGHFLVQGEDGVQIYAKSTLSDDIEQRIRAAFIIGNVRTPTQDIEYSIRHLVEIALRALSPGINDSYTAVHVLDHLSAALVILFEKDTPSEDFYDDEGVLRLKAKQSDKADIIFSAFDQIRTNGAHNPSLLRHLIAKFSVLVDLVCSEDSKRGLRQQLQALQQDLACIEGYVPDREDMNARLQTLLEKVC